MIEKIKKMIDFYKTKKGKAAFFFGFYLIFFFFLFLFITLIEPVDNTKVNNDLENNQEEVRDSKYTTERLESSDYQYKITIQNNYELEVLEGKISENNNILEYEYSELINLVDLKRIIKNAKYLTKTPYSDSTYKINYEIKSKDIYGLFNDDEELINDEINNLIITTNENSELISIEYDFSNYLNSINDSINIYKVLIEYEY